MRTKELPTALIIGASRGLGLAMAAEFVKRDWRVVGTVRGSTRTELHDLSDRFAGQVEVETVDIVCEEEVRELRRRLTECQFDLLFVNAGVTNNPKETIGEVTTEEFTRVMVTNALSPMRVIEEFESLVPSNGTIGVMSSGLGSVSGNTRGGWEVYRASKAALNTLMRSFAARHSGDSRSLVIIAPGHVRTGMGGSAAPLGVNDSIPGVVDTILGRSEIPGLAYLNYLGQTVSW